jgi:hypothetical protein
VPTRTVPAEIAAEVDKLDEAAAVRRWRTGQLRAAERQRVLLAQQGPRPAQAVAESLSVLNAMDDMGMWPMPRDQVSEHAIQQVRRRWARVQHRAKQAGGW